MRPAASLRYVVTTARWASRANTPRPPVFKAAGKPLPPPPPPPRPRKIVDASTIARARLVPIALLSITVAGMGFYAIQLYMSAMKKPLDASISDLAAQKDVAARYDDTADGFDSEVGFSELVMRINGMRKKLARKCTGDVLEVSCGTGRNLGYFDVHKSGAVESLTFLDLSPQMVQVCKKKWLALYGTQKLKPDLTIRFVTGSGLEAMPLVATSGKKYDTILQTMGLCSTPEPAELLTNMARHLDTSNPEARILLLEHGRSYMQWVNNILDSSAAPHAERYGCWFNRDIGALVEDAAAKSGLEVVSERRYHFGTTWMFELKPKAPAPGVSEAVPASTGGS